MRLRILLPMLSVALLGFAPAPFPRAERRRGEDLTDVAGTWAILRWERRGSREEVNEQRYVVRLTKEKFELVTQKRHSDDTFAMRLEPSYSPAAFRWYQGDRTHYVGSYRLQKDEITMVFKSGQRVEDRPTNFSGPAEFLFVMRRVRR